MTREEMSIGDTVIAFDDLFKVVELNNDCVVLTDGDRTIDCQYSQVIKKPVAATSKFQ